MFSIDSKTLTFQTSLSAFFETLDCGHIVISDNVLLSLSAWLLNAYWLHYHLKAVVDHFLASNLENNEEKMN